MSAARRTRDPVRSSPLPDGFSITLDESARELAPGIWRGGSPPRVVRLTAAGAAAWAELRGGAPIATPDAGRLGRRLTDAGLAHPVAPAPVEAPSVTVVIPVLDRPEALERCLTALGATPVVVVDDGSRDPESIAVTAKRHGAQLIRLEVNAGPATARNAGIAATDTEMIAFLDSDCIPPPDWLTPLAGHLGDPLVGAVAPRIRPLPGPGTAIARYAAVRSSLDLGSRAGLVGPGARVSYVPTAALVVRRDALRSIAAGTDVFDPVLRVGEDVDLVWRLGAAGWRVRYDPTVAVGHDEPATWLGLLERRFRYGTSAAPLARAHPGRAAPLVLHPWPALTIAALLARRPIPAAASFALTVVTTARTLRRAEVPTCGVVAMMAAATARTGLEVGRYATQFAAPALAAAAGARPRGGRGGRRGRRCAVAALLLAPPLTAWAQRRPALDPVRYVAAHLADEIAYGTGVWAGAVTHRTTAPLRPIIGRRRAPHRPNRSSSDGQ